MLPYADEPQAGRKFPFITILLILVNIAVFAYEVSLGETGANDFALRWGFTPHQFWSGQHLETLLTAIFLHGGLVHIFGNMLFLWVFGDNVEDQLGHFTYLIFYLVSGIVASLTFAVAFPHLDEPLVGASGAIAGVLGGYLLLYPRAIVRTILSFGPFLTVGGVAAVIVIGFWFVLQLFYSFLSIFPVAPTADSSVAFVAHVGGFIFGLTVTGLIRESRDQELSYWRTRQWWTRSFRNWLLLIIVITVGGIIGRALVGNGSISSQMFRLVAGGALVALALWDGIARLRGGRGLLGGGARPTRLFALIQILAALSLVGTLIAA